MLVGGGFTRFFASKCRNGQVLQDSCVKPTRLADIPVQQTASLTLKTVNDTRSQGLHNPALKDKKVRQLDRRKENTAA